MRAAPRLFRCAAGEPNGAHVRSLPEIMQAAAAAVSSSWASNGGRGGGAESRGVADGGESGVGGDGDGIETKSADSPEGQSSGGGGAAARRGHNDGAQGGLEQTALEYGAVGEGIG